MAAHALVTACQAAGCRSPGLATDDTDRDGEPGLPWPACRRALCPGVLLAVITAAVRQPGWAGQLITHARATGLVYAQHAIVLHAALGDDRCSARGRSPPPAPPPPTACTCPCALTFFCSRSPEAPAMTDHARHQRGGIQEADLERPVVTSGGDAPPLSVWVTAQRDARAPRAGRYPPAALARPGKMLPAMAAIAITRYTAPGELVADPMCGIGTTLIEAVHLGRDGIGVEYEPRWAALAAEEARPGPKTGLSLRLPYY